MLNNEKIILMTKLALYEQGEGKEKIPVGKFFKSDYIGMRLLSSFIYITIGYVVCLTLWAIVNGEKLISDIMNGGAISTLIWIGVLYIVTIIVYMLITYIFYTYKFKTSRRSLKEYNARLKQLHALQQKELETLLMDTDSNMEMVGEE